MNVATGAQLASSSRQESADGLGFGWHCRTIDAQSARSRIARRDGVQGRDVLEILNPLHRLIHDDALLRASLSTSSGERLSGTSSGHRIAVDGIAGLGKRWRMHRGRWSV